MTNKSKTGKEGEDKAAELLEKSGYRILFRNKRYGHLETDIICEDDEYIVFVEVKTRKYNPAFGRPSSAVDAKKRQNLINCAEAYLNEYGTKGKLIRLDVVEVYVKDGKVYKTEHLKNAITK